MNTYSGELIFTPTLSNMRNRFNNKNYHTLSNSIDFGQRRLQISELGNETVNSTKFNRTTKRPKTVKMLIKEIISIPFYNQTSPFLEGIYWKYSKNFQKYISNNKEGMKLQGNKYFDNISIEQFLKTRHKHQKKMFEKIKIHNIQSNYLNSSLISLNDTLDERTIVKLNNSINFSKNYHTLNDEDEFLLTPLPNKNRKLLHTDKEKKDFLNAERSAVVMRIFEYTHGIRTKFNMLQLRMIEEEKEREKINKVINKSVNIIKRWWRMKKKDIKRKEEIEKQKQKNNILIEKFSEYQSILIEKKKNNFALKLINYIKKKTLDNNKYVLMKLILIGKKLKKNPFSKKIRLISEWVNNIIICKNEQFQFLHFKPIHFKVKSINNYITKKTYCADDIELNTYSYGSQSTKGNMITSASSIKNNQKKFSYGIYDQIEKILMLQRCIRSYFSFKKITQAQRTIEMNNEREAFGIVKKINTNNNYSRELYLCSSKLKRSFKESSMNKLRNLIFNHENQLNDNWENEDDEYLLNLNSSKQKGINANDNNMSFVFKKNINKKNTLSYSNKISCLALKEIKNSLFNENNDLDNYQRANKYNSSKHIEEGNEDNNNNEDNEDDEVNYSFKSSVFKKEKSNIKGKEKDILVNQSSENSNYVSSNQKNFTSSNYGNSKKIKGATKYDKIERSNVMNKKDRMNKIQEFEDLSDSESKRAKKEKELKNLKNKNYYEEQIGNSYIQKDEDIVNSYNQEIKKENTFKLNKYENTNLLGKITKNNDKEDNCSTLIKNNYNNNIISKGNNSYKDNIASGSILEELITNEHKKRKKDSNRYGNIDDNTLQSSLKETENNNIKESELNNNNSNTFVVDSNRDIELNNKKLKIGVTFNQSKLSLSNNDENKLSQNKQELLLPKKPNENKEQRILSIKNSNYQFQSKVINQNQLHVEMPSYSNYNNNNDIETNQKIILDKKDKDINQSQLENINNQNIKRVPSLVKTKEEKENNKIKIKQLNKKNILVQSVKRKTFNNNNNNSNTEDSLENRLSFTTTQNFTFTRIPSVFNSYSQPFSYDNNKLSFILSLSMLPNSYFNFMPRPNHSVNSLITKIRKKVFSSNVSYQISKLIMIKGKNISIKFNIKLYLFFNKWKFNSNRFSSNLIRLSNTLIKVDNIKTLANYFNRLKYKKDIIYHFSKLLQQKVIKENYATFISNLSKEDKSKVYSYSNNITRISPNTPYNSKKTLNFKYYCKINKSNNENDFILIRMTLGYRLLKMLLCRSLQREFLIRLRKRRRRLKRAKTYFLRKQSTLNLFELLNFNNRLFYTVKRIVEYRFFSFFFHRLLYIALNANNNIEYDLEHSEICDLFREGYKKGYFKILYNILRHRFNFSYTDSNLTFEDFVQGILTMKRQY